MKKTIVLVMTGIAVSLFVSSQACAFSEDDMMEGMSYTIKGGIPTIFNYGDITVDKLGAQTFVVLKDASSPKKLERLVMKLQEKYVYERSVRDHHTLKGMLSDMIAYHHVQNEKLNSKRKE